MSYGVCHSYNEKKFPNNVEPTLRQRNSLHGDTPALVLQKLATNEKDI
jgi:hypothetical protein